MTLAKIKIPLSIRLPSSNAFSVVAPVATKDNPSVKTRRHRRARAKQKAPVKADGKGRGWLVTFSDGKTVEAPYYPNPRMAASYALKQYRGKIKVIKYVK